MSDFEDIEQVRDLAESVFASSWDSSSVGFDAGLWRTCDELGLARLTLPEAAGGSGASFAQAAAARLPGCARRGLADAGDRRDGLAAHR